VKEINTFIQQGIFTFLFLFQINAVLLSFFIHQEILKKYITVSTKLLSSKMIDS